MDLSAYLNRPESGYESLLTGHTAGVGGLVISIVRTSRTTSILIAAKRRRSRRKRRVMEARTSAVLVMAPLSRRVSNKSSNTPYGGNRKQARLKGIFISRQLNISGFTLLYFTLLCPFHLIYRFITLPDLVRNPAAFSRLSVCLVPP